MAKKSSKASKKGNTSTVDSDEPLLEGLLNTNSVPKKSKKSSSKEFSSKENLEQSIFLERALGIGEKRKLGSSDESPKKKKKAKKSDLDVSDHSEKMVKLSDSFSSTDEKSSIKHSKQGIDGSKSPSKASSLTNDKEGLLQTTLKSPKLEEGLGSPKGKSSKKAKKSTSSTAEKPKTISWNDETIKKSPKKQFVSDDSEESDGDYFSVHKEELLGEDSDDGLINTENQPSKKQSATKSSKEKDYQSVWTEEQTENLIDVMTKELKIKPDERQSFRQRLKKVSWGNIPEMLDPPRTAEECAQHLEEIFKKINTIRNLSEMFAAHKVGVQNRSRCAVHLPLQRFRAENSEAIKMRGGNYFITSKKMFDELPEDERFRRYIFPYHKELTEKNLKNPKKLNYNHSAFYFYKQRHPDLDGKEAKHRYAQLSPKKRLPYIRRSYEDLKNAWRVRVEMGVPADEKTKAPFCHLSKDEWLILLESMGMPIMEAKSPRQLFIQMNPEENSEDLKSKPFFSNHPDFEKYNTLFTEMREKFKKDFEKWVLGVKDDIVKKPAAAYYEDVMGVKVRQKPKTPSSVSKIISKVRELEESFVESGMVGNFPGEPKPSPLTAKEIFSDFIKRSNSKITLKEISKQFSALTDDFREKLESLAEKAACEYKEQIMEFVEKLPVTERKIYIGQNRVKFIKVFNGTDIFEEDYPCSEYPPFKKPSKLLASGKKRVSSELMTLEDFWTPKRKAGENSFSKDKLSTSTPMGAVTSPASSQSGPAPNDDSRSNEKSESSSDDESTAAERSVSVSSKVSPQSKKRNKRESSSDSSSSEEDSTNNFEQPSPRTPRDLTRSVSVRSKVSPQSKKRNKRDSSSDSNSSEEDSTNNFAQPSPRTQRDSGKKKIAKDPLSPSKLNAFLQAKATQSSSSVNGSAKFSPRKTSVQQNKQNAESESSSEEESDDDFDERKELSQRTKLTQRKTYTSSEESSEDDSEEELMPAWSQK